MHLCNADSVHERDKVIYTCKTLNYVMVNRLLGVGECSFVK